MAGTCACRLCPACPVRLVRCACVCVRAYGLCVCVLCVCACAPSASLPARGRITAYCGAYILAHRDRGQTQSARQHRHALAWPRLHLRGRRKGMLLFPGVRLDLYQSMCHVVSVCVCVCVCVHARSWTLLASPVIECRMCVCARTPGRFVYRLCACMRAHVGLLVVARDRLPRLLCLKLTVYLYIHPAIYLIYLSIHLSHLSMHACMHAHMDTHIHECGPSWRRP